MFVFKKDGVFLFFFLFLVFGFFPPMKGSSELKSAGFTHPFFLQSNSEYIFFWLLKYPPLAIALSSSHSLRSKTPSTPPPPTIVSFTRYIYSNKNTHLVYVLHEKIFNILVIYEAQVSFGLHCYTAILCSF